MLTSGKVFMDLERRMLLNKVVALGYNEALRMFSTIKVTIDPTLMAVSEGDVIVHELFDQAIREGLQEDMANAVRLLSR